VPRRWTPGLWTFFDPDDDGQPLRRDLTRPPDPQSGGVGISFWSFNAPRPGVVPFHETPNDVPKHGCRLAIRCGIVREPSIDGSTTS